MGSLLPITGDTLAQPQTYREMRSPRKYLDPVRAGNALLPLIFLSIIGRQDNRA